VAVIEPGPGAGQVGDHGITGLDRQREPSSRRPLPRTTISPQRQSTSSSSNRATSIGTVRRCRSFFGAVVGGARGTSRARRHLVHPRGHRQGRASTNAPRRSWAGNPFCRRRDVDLALALALADHLRVSIALTHADRHDTTEPLLAALDAPSKVAGDLPRAKPAMLPVPGKLELATVMLPRDAFFASGRWAQLGSARSFPVMLRFAGWVAGILGVMSFPVVDDTLSLLMEGYGWLPDRRRRAAGNSVRTRVMGQRAVGLCGPDAARFFYDESHIERRTAVPEPVQGTLFGHGAVHTLDGEAHRFRKAMFTSLMSPQGVAELVKATEAVWDEAAAWWPRRGNVVLFDEVSRVITRGVCDWTGVPLADDEVANVAADLVALVDGFATLGPRHWRARVARARLESRLADLVRRVRTGEALAPEGSALSTVAAHRDADGAELGERVAAVELLNVIRPTVAVCWFVAFAAHALHRWPQHRAPLAADKPGFAQAFVDEVRRFYPFAPFIGGRAVRDLSWEGCAIPEGTLVLLDLYGQNHDAAVWPDPYSFDPERFLGRQIGAYELVPQGGGDPTTGHRCPGEAITILLLQALTVRLARLTYTVPAQDLTISLRRIPARPTSGMVINVTG
jgi:fatty-acid peroxygenase